MHCNTEAFNASLCGDHEFYLAVRPPVWMSLQVDVLGLDIETLKEIEHIFHRRLEGKALQFHCAPVAWQARIGGRM